MGNLLFVTGTDTGVGKTLFTASLLKWLRNHGERAWALKPFCSGSRRDAKLLFQLQDEELPINVVNPIYFREPVAPLVAARENRKPIAIKPILRSIKALQRESDWLIVEGCGGLMVPLCEGYTLADFIGALDCMVVVIAANKLGAINHALMTVRALTMNGSRVCAVVLVNQRRPDQAARTNCGVVQKFLPHCNCLEMRYLGKSSSGLLNVEKNFTKTEKTLAQFVNAAIVTAVRERKARS